MLSQQRDRFLERAHLFVGEWRRLHVSSQPFFLIVTGKRSRSMRGAPDPLAVFTLAAYKACTKSGEAPMPQEFEGKVVVVSGGSRGIGRGLAAAGGLGGGGAETGGAPTGATM